MGNHSCSVPILSLDGKDLPHKGHLRNLCGITCQTICLLKAGNHEAWYDRCRGYGSTCSLTRRTGSIQGEVGGLVNGAEEVSLMADAIFVLVGFDITGSLMGVALLEPMAAPVAKILRLVHFLSLDFLYLCTFKRWVFARPAEAASFLLFGLVRFGLVWFGLVWFGSVWFVWFVWFGLVWFGLVWSGLTGESRNIWRTRI